MKKLHLLGMTMIIALAFASCGGKKEIVYVQQPAPQQQYQQGDNQQNNINGNSSFNDAVTLNISCLEESLDKPGEYMAALGIVEGRKEIQNALVEANKMARDEIQERFIGVIKNASTYYSKDTTIPSGKQTYENNIEGVATNACKKALDKYLNAVCREYRQSPDGTYIGIVACHIPIKNVIDEMKKEMDETLKGQYDQKKYFEYMEQELNESYK